MTETTFSSAERAEGLARPGFLAIAERGIGDALTLLPSLRALRAARPDLRVELLTPGLFQLAENLSDTATVLDHRSLLGLGHEDRFDWLRHQGIEWVWNTEGEHGEWTQALKAAARPTWINSAAQRNWGGKYVLRVRFEQLRLLFPELRTPGDIRLSLTPAQQAESISFRSRFPRQQLLVALQPGAGDPNRVWPVEKFHALIRALAGWPQVTVLLFLDPADEVSRGLVSLSAEPNVQCLREPLHRVVPRLAACDLFIGNDSGFYHLSYALGLSVVGVYRSLRGAQRWGHRSARSRTVCCWMPRQLQRDWTRWVSVDRVLRAARSLAAR